MTSKPAIKEDYCPAQSGNFIGYEPEYKDSLGEWKRVPIETNYYPSTKGMPPPLCMGGVLNTLGLFGHAQAMALAYSFAAHYAASGAEPEVRIVKYRIEYDLKAKKLENKP